MSQYEELNETPFEPSPDLLELIKRIDAERDLLRARIGLLSAERQSAINAEAQAHAVLKRGDKVCTVHRRKIVDAEISGVTGSLFQLDHIARIIISYDGFPMKADGTFGDHKQLHTIKVPASAAKGERP